ncbi:hypothetical protein GCM10028818_07010 [Spirosoma horti]
MAVLYTIWGLLNIGLGITLFVVSYRYFRFFSQRYGLLATGILFLLTVSMCQSPETNQSAQANKGLSTTTVLIPNFSAEWVKPYQARLVDLGSFQLNQDLMVHRKSQSDSTQITSAVYLTGFISGILWKPITSVVTVGQDRHIHYTSAGVLEWRLLGLPLYNQLQQFTGSVPLDSLRTQ